MRYNTRLCIVCGFFFFQAEDGIRDLTVTGVQTCALPISADRPSTSPRRPRNPCRCCSSGRRRGESGASRRSEEHTSELQSQSNLVCRLLLEKKKDHEMTEIQSLSYCADTFAQISRWSQSD